MGDDEVDKRCVEVRGSIATLKTAEAATDEAKQAFGNDRQLSDPGNEIPSVAGTYVIVAFIFKYISTSSADIHSFDFTVVRYYTYSYRI